MAVLLLLLFITFAFVLVVRYRYSTKAAAAETRSQSRAQQQTFSALGPGAAPRSPRLRPLGTRGSLTGTWSRDELIAAADDEGNIKDYEAGFDDGYDAAKSAGVDDEFTGDFYADGFDDGWESACLDAEYDALDTENDFY